MNAPVKQFERRPYQEEGGALIRQAFQDGYRRVGYTLPTGAGKSFVFSRAAEAAAAKGKRVCVMAHRVEIVDQVCRTLAEMGIAHGVIAADRTPMRHEIVQVASVQTLVRRLSAYPHFDLIITDETHHCVSPTYVKIMAHYPKAYSLGVSATFERLDGRGFGDAFDKLIIGPSIRELTNMGYLCPSVVYAPAAKLDLSPVHTRMGDYDLGELDKIMNASVITGDAIEHYKRLCPGQPAVAFCVSIKHSEQVAAQFRAAGIKAAHVDGGTDRIERKRLLAALDNGTLDVLTNCGLISEGVDIRRLAAVLLLRPTQSLALWLQMVGRALRQFPGKEKAIILDHANCTARFGLPDDPREWSLDGRKRKKKSDDPEAAAPNVRQCSNCYCMCLATAKACPGCGMIFTVVSRVLEHVEGDLVEVVRDPETERLRTMSYREAVRWADGDFAKLLRIARARGYRRGWAQHQVVLADRYRDEAAQ